MHQYTANLIRYTLRQASLLTNFFRPHTRTHVGHIHTYIYIHIYIYVLDVRAALLILESRLITKKQQKCTSVRFRCGTCTRHIDVKGLIRLRSRHNCQVRRTGIWFGGRIHLCFFFTGRGGGILDRRDVLDVMHGRNRMTIDPRIPTMPGRSMSDFHRPGRQCLHQARSAVRCPASRMTGELHPTTNHL